MAAHSDYSDPNPVSRAFRLGGNVKIYSLLKKTWDGDPIAPGLDHVEVLEHGLPFEIAEHKCDLLNSGNRSQISWYEIREDYAGIS